MGAPRKADKLTEPSPAELRAIREGREDLTAGRYTDHRTFSEWLRTWGGKPKPPVPSPKT